MKGIGAMGVIYFALIIKITNNIGGMKKRVIDMKVSDRKLFKALGRNFVHVLRGFMPLRIVIVSLSTKKSMLNRFRHIKRGIYTKRNKGLVKGLVI